MTRIEWLRLLEGFQAGGIFFLFFVWCMGILEERRAAKELAGEPRRHAIPRRHVIAYRFIDIDGNVSRIDADLDCGHTVTVLCYMMETVECERCRREIAELEKMNR
jgi:hypothetical protein